MEREGNVKRRKFKRREENVKRRKRKENEIQREENVK